MRLKQRTKLTCWIRAVSFVAVVYAVASIVITNEFLSDAFSIVTSILVCATYCNKHENQRHLIAVLTNREC